jgi:hypothetical protein
MQRKGNKQREQEEGVKRKGDERDPKAGERTRALIARLL